jgi:hypothetical protein
MKYKICVSGSATDNCLPEAFDKAREIGREVIRQDGVVVTGATIGIPREAAKGAKEENGFSIGISPASSKREHLKKYRLPLDYMDLVIFTGMDYSGRNLILIRATDASIFICGRIGTLNEFTIAFEDKKPIGILTGTGGIAEEIEEILDVAQRGHGKVVIDDDPKRLVDKVMEMVRYEHDIE